MKTKVALIAIGLCMVAGLVLADPGADTPWYDPQNCSMCSNMLAQPGLMEHMTMENFVIGTGTMTVTTVDPKFEAAYATAMKAMQATGQELMSGKEMPLCGCCQDVAKLMTAGAKMENVDAKGAHVMLLTSTDPETIKQLQAHGQRSIEEMAKMMGEMEEGHEGHGH